MHVRKSARDLYFPRRVDDVFFGPRGDVAFASAADARRFVDRIEARRSNNSAESGEPLRPAEVAAMALVHELSHAVLAVYRERRGASFDKLRAIVTHQLGDAAHQCMVEFIRTFPPPSVYPRLAPTPEPAGVSFSAEEWITNEGTSRESEIHEELLLLWLANQNPAYAPVRSLISDAELSGTYTQFIAEAQRFFREDAPFGPGGENLIDTLLAPSRAAPHSILAQLQYIEDHWGHAFGLVHLAIWRRLLWAKDIIREEGKYFFRGGPGPGAPLLEPMRFAPRSQQQDEAKQFSADLDWMPHVVLIAKTVFVWLDQLSRKYGRAIERLDQIPDEELDTLARRGFTGLWLIGLFERSHASKQIKQLRGDHDAVASAYSLMRYDIASELGGYSAYEDLKSRAWQRGIRLAADMVPNHVGIDADWVINHPEWFLQCSQPPFPGYRFGGPDLSRDHRVGVFLEEGYWDKTDAAVVFRRHDRLTGEDRYLYHGNDGTSMPWNDTAQLDYTRNDVRAAVIETILHVARLFPIIRFDAAMTLAKRHFSRLWFPPPGGGGAIPSRADYAMTPEQFDHVFPAEFWREVVDTVRERAPDTLLLAEAFWMMEGYFVRTLGMHRVYNSAFMNMLKREENAKYRETIKNVLDYEPEILKRFVNFMNNPDEDTAIAQFGSDDKYFGVAIVMSTMPGLPMFGHGQVEGFHEKYGMEFRRPKMAENENTWLVDRHEREVFPVLKKRYLFSEVSQFCLYDFLVEGSEGVDDDVFAYTNGRGGERALVLYNNKFKQTRGRLSRAIPTRRDDGGVTAPTLSEALGLNHGVGQWVVFRDIAKNIEYLRHRHAFENGFAWTLDAFKYHVFSEFRVVSDEPDAPYAKLAAELGDGGTPSVEIALTRVRFRALHQPLREALGHAHLAYLLDAIHQTAEGKPAAQAMRALCERLEHIADGLDYMQPAMKEARVHARASACTTLCEYYTKIFGRFAEPSRSRPVDTKDSADRQTGEKPESESPRERAMPPVEYETLLAWAYLQAALTLLAAGNQQTGANAAAAMPVDAWALPLAVRDAFDGTSDADARAALVLAAAELRGETIEQTLVAALDNARAKAFLGVHTANSTEWLNQEAFERFATFLIARDVLRGRIDIQASHDRFASLTQLAALNHYMVTPIARELAAAAPALAAPSEVSEMPLAPEVVGD